MERGKGEKDFYTYMYDLLNYILIRFPCNMLEILHHKNICSKKIQM